MFHWRLRTKIPTATFSPDFEKIGIGILVTDFQENILMNLDKFQNLLNKFLFNLIRHSTLCDLPFQSYVQTKTNKNVTARHSYMDEPRFVFRMVESYEIRFIPTVWIFISSENKNRSFHLSWSELFNSIFYKNNKLHLRVLSRMFLIKNAKHFI